MKIAIMQPYLFPYVGYFQLIHCVDTFVFFDDVNYIKKGWINRNTILVNNAPYLFTVPVTGASQNKLINEVNISTQINWKNKLVKNIEHAYKKASFYDVVFPFINEIIMNAENNLAKFLAFSLRQICNYLNIDTVFKISSEIPKDNKVTGQDKILEICKRLHATHYVNAIGGRGLYDNKAFSGNDIVLNFIKGNLIEYRQFNKNFIPSLSIIDVMMFNSAEDIKQMFEAYELL